MNAETLLHNLATRGFTLTAEGPNLRWKAPEGEALTPDLRALLVAHKPALLAHIAAEEHRAFVEEGLRMFPGSSLPEGAEPRFNALKALAKRHVPDLDPWGRLEVTCEALAAIVSRLHEAGDVVAEAQARAVWLLLEAFCETWRARG